MKKLLLASLCIASVALTACDKKPNESTSGSTTTSEKTIASLSTNNATDIKSDLAQIQTLSTSKAKELIDFQTEMMQAVQKKDKNALTAVFDKMKVYIEAFNKDLDNLTLKSTEAEALREKMKESNKLSLELTEASTANPPDMNKLTELQKKASEIQKSLLADMQKLQTTANTAK
ncbi:hypothetical protein [Acinetobacter sp. ANC 4648]|uniref:hypothetical protein n=1 Tax=Acinetobacter sp. ANC 4648 TaxID=1977875 RepID=UPI000A35B563|nr:hypothetical protein [Acinetobacter sp. ANC 4648]OTG85122.1 hypothetical protein B9T27_02625 [Acinetobacter sp. ANC 4648]